MSFGLSARNTPLIDRIFCAVLNLKVSLSKSCVHAVVFSTVIFSAVLTTALTVAQAAEQPTRAIENVLIENSLVESSPAQKPQQQLNFGVFGTVSFLWHQADYSVFPSLNFFSSGTTAARRLGATTMQGTGIGFAAGILAEYALSDAVMLQARLGWHGLGGQLQAKESLRIGYITSPNTVVFEDATIVHQLTSNLGAIVLEPGVRAQIINTPLFAEGGIALGVLVSTQVTALETLTTPSNNPAAVFNTGTPQRNNLTTSIKSAEPPLVSFFIGMSADIPLGGTLALSPFVRYYIPFTSIATASWLVNSLHGGLAVKF